MKRKIALLVIIGMILSICLAGCGQQTQATATSQLPTYNKTHQISSSDLEKNTVIHEGLTGVLPELKNLVRQSLGENNYLNWEQFEAVSEIREFARPELAGDFAETTAFHAVGSRVIVVCPKFFDLQGGDQGTYVLTHELIHSLVGVGKSGEERSMYLFAEGITDYLANLVLRDAGLNYSLNYQNELYCISWLATLYGADDVTRMVCDGSILSFIDERVGRDNAGADLNNSLAVIDKSSDQVAVREAILTEMDILAEVSGSNTEVCGQFTEIFRAAYAPYLN